MLNDDALHRYARQVIIPNFDENGQEKLLNTKCLIIGFSAETENIVKNAQEKLIAKNIDLIIANDVGDNKVFGKDINKVYVIDKNNCEEWAEQSKKSIAFKIADKINKILSLNSK